jgi:hypothetical protein
MYKYHEHKKPLAVSGDQAVLLRGDIGYRIVQRGRVRHHLKQVPFPNIKKAIQVS